MSFEHAVATRAVVASLLSVSPSKVLSAHLRREGKSLESAYVLDCSFRDSIERSVLCVRLPVAVSVFDAPLCVQYAVKDTGCMYVCVYVCVRGFYPTAVYSSCACDFYVF